MTQRVRVAKPGINALTDTNPNNFVFDSAFNTFKIIAEGTATFSLSNNPFEVQEHTITHGLGYIPFVIAYCKFPDGYISGVGSWQRNSSNTWFASLRVDTTYVYFGFANSVAGNPQVTVKYYLTEVPL